jgi:hypothetical protein
MVYLRPGPASHGCIAIAKVFLYYNMHARDMKTFLNHSVCKPHQNPMGSFKDLSIHSDRQAEMIMFYTMSRYND